MNELHEALDKLFTEVDHLDRITDSDDRLSPDEVLLALTVAKKVKRHSTLLVRVLAASRDETATAQEGTSE